MTETTRYSAETEFDPDNDFPFTKWMMYSDILAKQTGNEAGKDLAEITLAKAARFCQTYIAYLSECADAAMAEIGDAITDVREYKFNDAAIKIGTVERDCFKEHVPAELRAVDSPRVYWLHDESGEIVGANYFPPNSRTN